MRSSRPVTVTVFEVMQHPRPQRTLAEGFVNLRPQACSSVHAWAPVLSSYTEAKDLSQDEHGHPDGTRTRDSVTANLLLLFTITVRTHHTLEEHTLLRLPVGQCETHHLL